MGCSRWVLGQRDPAPHSSILQRVQVVFYMQTPWGASPATSFETNNPTNKLCNLASPRGKKTKEWQDGMSTAAASPAAREGGGSGSSLPRSLGCGRGAEEGSRGGKATQAEVWPRFGSSWQGRAEERDGRKAGLGYKAAGMQAVAEF